MEPHDMEMASEGKESINRTGIMTNPELSAELIEGTRQSRPGTPGDASARAELRATYLEGAAPIGSPPAMVEVSEDGETLGRLDAMTILLDKLGERLAFERQGTRLYEAVIQKCELLSPQEASAPTVDELRDICAEELEHFRMLQRAITDLGGDATVKTPSANIGGVMSKGVLEIAVDPRTTIGQTLQALLTAELVDNDGWQMLQDLANELGQDDLEKQCRKAFEKEQEHLDKVREWLLSMTIDKATGPLDETAESDDVDDNEEKPARKSSKRSRKAKSSGSAKSKSRKKKR